MMMKRLEAKYAALQIVPVISKLGMQKVCLGHYVNFSLSAKLKCLKIPVYPGTCM